MSTAIETTLDERGARYGAYSEHARITQNIKRAMRDSRNWNQLQDDQRETLEMLAHKIGRILNGDPEYLDSWHDMEGYTHLSSDLITERARIKAVLSAMADDFELHPVSTESL